MRYILFRGKRVDNGEWVYGSYCEAEMNNHGGTEHFIIECSCRGSQYYVDHKTVGLYTGMTDMTGTMVFEGDILCAVSEYTGEKLFATVNFGEYEDENALGDDHFVGWYLAFRVNGEIVNVSILSGQSDNMLAIKMSEVIGNIYDNPELLEGGDEK